MQIELKKPSEIKPYFNNPRKNDDAVIKVAESIQSFGFQNPIIVDKNLTIIAGHTRWKAALKLDLKQIPIIITDMPEDKAKAYRIADNRLGEFAEWDWEKLELEMEDLDEEIKKLLDFEIPDFTEPQPGLIDDDEIPEEVETRCKKGDLWILGGHRLLCGDATNKEDVDRLMDGQKADMCLTDPPYSVNYASRKENPDETLKSYQDPDNAEDLLYGFMSIMPTNCLIMTYADKHLHPYVRVCDKLKMETIDLLVWKKQNFCFWAGARYQQQHELIFLARKIKSKFYSKTPGNASTVVEIDRQTKNDIHPTIRPLVLWSQLLQHHTQKGNIVYDPFLGSGTTILACEKHNRNGYGLEISPNFCDVTIERWEQFTGGKAELING